MKLAKTWRLTMRLSDVRRRIPKLIYFKHSTLLVLNQAATGCSNRLLDSPRHSIDSISNMRWHRIIKANDAREGIAKLGVHERALLDQIH